jgi:hypothetical protein
MNVVGSKCLNSFLENARGIDQMAGEARLWKQEAHYSAIHMVEKH